MDEVFDEISINDLQVDCIIGIYDEERKQKQKLFVTIKVYTTIEKAGKSDDIDDTIDYDRLKELIFELSSNNYKLLEAYAEDISREALKQEKIDKVEVLIKKPNAIPEANYTSVRIVRAKNL